MNAALTNPDLTAAIGWTLLHFVWQGALIGCATALRMVGLRNARPQARYALACAALLLCLAWPAVDLALLLGAGTGGASGARTLDRLAGAAFGAVGDGAGLLGWLQAHLGWIVALWAACTGALGLRMTLGLLWIARAARARAADPQWQARLTNMAARCGLTRKVVLRVVDGIASPVTAGWWRPVVLVPASLLSGMDPSLLEALLAHELGHVRRHDYLVNLVQNVVETLLFYHPAVWWISRRIRVEREQIADDFAARQLGEPRRLALALSALERMRFADGGLAPAANGGDLAARIRRLLRPSTQALDWKAAIPVLGLALACAAHANVAVTPAAAPALVAQAGSGPTQRPLLDFSSCRKPDYPRADLEAGHEGSVKLDFLVDERGAVREAKISQSSGYASLDETARSALARCGFHPALAGGLPVQRWTEVKYVWTMK